MDEKKLLGLIKKEEGIKLDFKLRLDLATDSGKRELAKDVCAIANSRGGRGYIIVGIADKSKDIIGISDNDIFKEEQIQQIISSRCEPPIPVVVDFFNVADRRIGVITIYDGEQKPYQLRENGAFYIRRGSTTDIMRKQELISSFEENLCLQVETCPIMRSSIEVLNMDLVNKYFRGKGIYINKENKNFLLQSAGISFLDKETRKEVCTFGGLIVFSEENNIYIPNNMIRIINKIRQDYEEVTIITGTLVTMIEKSEKVLKEILPRDYPSIALIEAIKNAVLYREYCEVNRIIEVIITNNSIVIESPGEIIPKKIKGKNSDYIRRNMWIYEKLITLDDRKMFFNNGRGFSRMKNAYEGKNKVRLINSKMENSFKVILPGTNYCYK